MKLKLLVLVLVLFFVTWEIPGGRFFGESIVYADDDEALIEEMVQELDSSTLPQGEGFSDVHFYDLENPPSGVDTGEMGFGSPFSVEKFKSKFLGVLATFFGMDSADKAANIVNSTSEDAPGFNSMYGVAKDAIDNNFFVSVLGNSGATTSGESSSISLPNNWGSLEFQDSGGALGALGYFWVAFCGLVGLLDFLRG
jgi:hypothetical protein